MRSLLALLFALIAIPALGVEPWVVTYPTPLRERYASPTGVGGSTLDYKASTYADMIGGITTVAGVVAGGNQKALSFDGVNDSLIMPTTGIASDTTFTVTVAFKSDTTTLKHLFIEANASVATQRIRMTINDGGADIYRVAMTNDAGTSWSATCTGVTTNDNAWHTAGIRFNAGTLTAWREGAVCATATGVTGTFTLTRGCIAQSCIQGAQSYQKVTVDELKIYNIALSDAQMLSDHNSGAATFGSITGSNTDLYAAFHFDELQAGDIANPYNIELMNNNTVKGDIVWLRGGTYVITDIGGLDLTVSGDATNNVVYRNYPGEHPIIDGGINITADYTWLWGLDVQDPDNSVMCDTPPFGLIDVLSGSDHARIINNYIHDGGDCAPASSPNMTAFREGLGGIWYGNIVDGTAGFGHGLYTGNLWANGARYVVNNIHHDSSHANIWNLHVFGTANTAQGYDVENNIFYQKTQSSTFGKVLLGGKAEDCDYQNVYKGNQHYQATLQIGWNRPIQVRIEDNYFGRASANLIYWWGEGETRCDPGCTLAPCGIAGKPLPNIFTGNTILQPSGTQMQLTSAAYLNWNGGQGVNQGTPALMNPGVGTGDVFDNNIWFTPMNINLFANSTTTNGISSMGAWRTATTLAGKQYDSNSTTVSAMPTTDYYKLTPNEYDAKIAHLAAYNWDLSANISVNVSGAFPLCAQCQVFKASDPYGTPVLSFTNFGSAVSIPVAGSAEFEAFIIRQVSP